MILKPALLVAAALLVATTTVTSEGSRQKRAGDVDLLQGIVVQLSQQVNTLSAQLTQMNTELAALRAKTGSMDTAVAFYASNSINPIRAVPYGTLIFDTAITNEGKAYDSSTGVFTVPVEGLYYFQTVFQAHHVASGGAVHAGIYVDGYRKAGGISDTQHNSNDETTINVIVHAHAGQKVFVKSPDNQINEYRAVMHGPRTTFSGFLIHEG